MLENSHAWMGASSSSIADSYQYQLQSMWQKCWNTNQNLMHHLRFRERGPLKSWRPETMAEAIFSVLKEGLSLSQAARKYDIPYPTFVLYANRVHNMLGPSIDGGPDLRPKGRGRPQRILLGIWPDEHIKGVIKTVVFRDAKDLKDDSSLVPHLPYGRHSPVFPFQDSPLNYPGVSGPCPNGMPTATGEQMSQDATAAAVAAVAHNIRQQMQMAAAVQHQQHAGEGPIGPGGLFSLPAHLQATTGGPQMPGTGPGGIPLPKASISPALSSGSNPAGGGGPGGMLGQRHASSPCGPGLPGLPNLPPSMAVALQMAGGPGGRCDPTVALLSQQQQHQLQQLHLQQQHALQQQQQQQHPGLHPLGFGAPGMGGCLPAVAIASTSASTASSILTPTTATITSGGLQSHGAMTTQPIGGGITATSSASKHKTSPLRSETPIHSPLTELSLELSSFKSARGVGVFSPTRLFADDIADLVGAVTASRSSSACGSSTGGGGGGGGVPTPTTTATMTSQSTATATTTATASITAAMSASAASGASDTANSGSCIKTEPIATNE